ncbi:TonB-dependent receptor [Granulicella tundricola]|nr:carboxypeptidase regulatory-like domain-containing protein [Granulicella tundricola]
MKAQVANNTSLVGTVTDAAGALVTGAKVVGVNRDTKVAYPAVTNGEGYYSIPYVLPGTYDITVEHAGFSKVLSSGVTVVLNVAARTDVVLAVGSDTSEVTVSAATAVLSTDDALLGETLGTKQVENLPQNTRRVMELAATASNIIIGPKTSYNGNPPGANFIGAGTREVTNSLTLDGITIMNSLISNSSVTPNPDAVGAVQTQTGNYTAQYGAYMGVHINVDTKSGTNKFHGTAYDYVQNNFFNAKGWLTPSNQPTPIQRFNQFGGEVGGPIRIPHLFDGRDKLFFMGSYEGLRSQVQNSTPGTVITDAERTGDFSDLCSAFTAGLCTTGKQIYNPVNATPYLNNKITNISPIATALLTYFPHPNLAGTVNNINLPVGNVFNKNATLDRVDYDVNEKVRLFARYTYEKSNAINGALVTTSSSYSPTTDTNAVIGYTHIITPRLINDFRFGFNKFSSNQLNYFYVNGPAGAGTALGIPGFNSDTTITNNAGIPTIAISDGYNGLGAEGTNWFQDDRTLHGYDQISYTFGKHNLMAGADIRKMGLGRAAQNQPRGQFTFNDTYTGNAVADFLTGYSSQAITPLTTVKGSVAEWRDGFFVQDNWQATQKLTLLYGVRYELPTVPYSLNGFARILNTTYTALIPTSSATNAATFTPTPGFKFTGPNHDLVSPRLGVAYRATDRIVVRGGGGIYYNPNHLNAFTLASGNYPIAASVSYNGNVRVPPALTALGNVSFANPSGGASATASPVAGTPGTYVNQFTDNFYLPTPRLYQWNLDTGVELWKNGAFEMQYLGSHSIHLDHSQYVNTPTPAAGAVNPRRPYQLFGDIRQIQNDGLGTYHGLTVIYRQRAFHGLDANLSYTWSHTLDTSNDANGGGTPMIQYNLRADYGNANWDIPNRFVGTVTYAMPPLTQFGHLTDTLVGGWQANAIVTIQSGMPFNVSIAENQANVGSIGTQRPNYVHAPSAKNCTRYTRINGAVNSSKSCIDLTAYSLPTQYTFGNTHRNDLHGPGQINVNFSMFKNFAIVEGLKLQFRGEAFNLFNHVDPGNPNSGLPSFSGGTNTFGTITSIATGTSSRVLQLAGKIIF